MKILMLLALLLSGCVTRSDSLAKIYDEKITITKQRIEKDRKPLSDQLALLMPPPDANGSIDLSNLTDGHLAALHSAMEALEKFDTESRLEILTLEAEKERDIYAIDRQEQQDWQNLSQSVQGLNNTMQNIKQQDQIRDLQAEQQRLRNQQELDRTH